MPLVSNGVAIDLGLDPFLLHFIHCLGINLGGGLARARCAQGERVLQRVCILHCILEPSRGVLLAWKQDVSHFLPVRI